MEPQKQLVELTIKCTYVTSGSHDYVLAFARTITIQDLDQINVLDNNASMVVLDVQVSPADVIKPAPGTTHNAGTSDTNPPMTERG